MELSMSGTSLRTFGRCVTCLARTGSELVLLADRTKLEMHTLNSSQSAYGSVSLARDFFDHFSLPAATARAPSSTPLQCSVLLKSVLAVLRTPHSTLDRLVVSLPDPDAPKLQFTLHCLNGVIKTYWISCNAEPEVRTLALDRGRFPSRLVIRPRELARLLSNFQSSLQELTIIAADPAVGLPGVREDVGGKAVKLRSYIDPTKDDSDTRLQTQLFIDPAQEFEEYVHTGDAVDVTFGLKELKAFLTFCEGCEVDILLFFDKAGEPLMLVPRLGLDDGATSDFEATLILATMTVSQLIDSNGSRQPPTSTQHAEETCAAASLVPENVSNHTKIWSDLSGTSKSFEANREIHARKERMNHTSIVPNDINAPSMPPVAANAKNTLYQGMQPLQMDHLGEHPEVISANARSQHHPSNWVGADDNDDDNEEDDELLVQTTPHYMESD